MTLFHIIGYSVQHDGSEIGSYYLYGINPWQLKERSAVVGKNAANKPAQAHYIENASENSLIIQDINGRREISLCQQLGLKISPL